MEMQQLKNAEELAKQGRVFFDMGKPAMAHRCYAQAVLLHPNHHPYHRMLANCLPHIVYRQYDALIQRAVEICFDDLDIAHRKLSGGWLRLVLMNPFMVPLIDLSTCDTEEEFYQALNFKEIIQCLNDPFFCKGLKHCLLMSVQLEVLLIRLRKFIFLKATSEQQKKALPFLLALAMKSFSNEYVFQISEEENKKIEEWQNKINLTLEEVIILGGYIPLYQSPLAEKLSIEYQNIDEKEIQEVFRLLLIEPLEEKNIIKRIESFSAVEDDLSNRVRQQYEEHPYPRWQNITPSILGPLGKAKSIGRDVLVAGCGTGQESSLLSSQMPNAAIDAIDLSKTSLAFAIRQSAKSGCHNIRYLQGDLLDVQKLNKKYDIIFSSGVLHHMQDPAAGLSSLKNAVKEKGVLAIALYSEIARTQIAEVQNWIKDRKYPQTFEGIRQFREDVINLPEDDPIKKIFSVSDFYNLSECRDLLFHVQEHRFTCLGLKALIEKQGLVLLDFGGRFPLLKKSYLAQYPDDPKALNLENWHEFEKQHPSSFLRMYDMLLGRAEDFKEEDRAIPEWLRGLGIFSD